MAITKWDPFPDLTSLRDDIESLWAWPFVTMARRGAFVPAVDVYDNEDAIMIKADVAGLKPEDVEVEVNDNLLTIRGERKQEEETEKKGYTRIERRYGSFERSISLPAPTKVGEIDATCQDGVLTVRVPKGEVKKAERIEIKPGKQAAPVAKDDTNEVA